MMRFLVGALAMTCLLTTGASGFQRARRASGLKANAAPPDGTAPNPTFEGTLKMLTSKVITLQLQSDQLLEIRRDHKTKFVENDKEIKPSDIAVGTPLAIDVREDLDLKPVAVRVVANPPPPKPQDKDKEVH